MERLPFWGQMLVVAALGLLVIGGAYKFWPGLEEMGSTIERLEGEYAEMEQEILKGRAIEKKLPEFEREIANLQRKLGDVQQILPSMPETGDLLGWVKNLADQSNLELKSFVPGGTRPAEFYREFPIQMEVVGRYHDLGLFMDRVSKYSRIINVDNMQIRGHRGGGTDKTIRASFTATTFVYDEGSETEGER